MVFHRQLSCLGIKRSDKLILIVACADVCASIRHIAYVGQPGCDVATGPVVSGFRRGPAP